MDLYKVTVWNGNRLVAVAENIVACGEKEARARGLKALASRAPVKDEVRALYREQFKPWSADGCGVDGLRVLVHAEPEGVVV